MLAVASTDDTCESGQMDGLVLNPSWNIRRRAKSR